MFFLIQIEGLSIEGNGKSPLMKICDFAAI